MSQRNVAVILLQGCIAHICYSYNSTDCGGKPIQIIYQIKSSNVKILHYLLDWSCCCWFLSFYLSHSQHHWQIMRQDPGHRYAKGPTTYVRERQRPCGDFKSLCNYHASFCGFIYLMLSFLVIWCPFVVVFPLFVYMFFLFALHLYL